MAEPLTDEQMGELSDLLTSGNRTGYYIRYYEFTGSDEAILQAEISSFSGLAGGAAIAGNTLAKYLENNLGEGDYPDSIVEFSQRIAVDHFAAVQASATGILTDAQQRALAQRTWDELGVEFSFPGNFLVWWDQLSTGDWEGLGETLDVESAIAAPLIAVWSAMFAQALGNQKEEFLSSGQFELLQTEDSRLSYVAHVETGLVVWVEDEDDLLQDYDDATDWIKTYFSPVIAALEEWVSNSFLNYLGEPPDAVDQELMIDGEGSGNYEGTPTPDFFFGEGESDFFVGADAGDFIYLGEGDDVAFGESGNDVIFGDLPESLLAILDLGNQATFDDEIDGGTGDDLLFGGPGDDTLISDFGANRFSGGDGEDTLELLVSDKSGSDGKPLAGC